VKLNDIPDLIVIVCSAVPHLNEVPISSASISEIHTFAFVGPGDTVISRHRELLIGVVSGTTPDL